MKTIDRYIQLANLLGDMFPRVLEVVVHDFSDLDHSIVHIVNSHISGRKVGDGASELGIRRLLKKESIPDVLVNYTNQNSLGKQLKSASLAIRDDEGIMIGAFCLNFDNSHFEQFKTFLDGFINYEINSFVGTDDIKTKTREGEVEKEIRAYQLKHNLTNITYKNKQDIVSHLLNSGFFDKRGSISSAAEVLQLSRQCIYNYLNKSS